MWLWPADRHPVGWNPSGVCWPKSPLLYVPTVSPPGTSPAGYRLPPDTGLAGLEQQIVAAMTQSSFLSVLRRALASMLSERCHVVVLSGALPTVLCHPPRPG